MAPDAPRRRAGGRRRVRAGVLAAVAAGLLSAAPAAHAAGTPTTTTTPVPTPAPAPGGQPLPFVPETDGDPVPAPTRAPGGQPLPFDPETDDDPYLRPAPGWGQLDAVVENMRNWLVGILAAVATLFFTVGGLRYMAAGGDPGEVDAAKRCFRNAAVGYALAVLAPLFLAALRSVVGA